jgi:hypothetical protein
VRAANTRTTASGCADGAGKSPALERSASRQSTERSASKYRAADIEIGAISNSSRIINAFLNPPNPIVRPVHTAVIGRFI